ncbi:hypothetical protein M1116_02150 [Patescibacteria group bacterium]|nr:hypothetical protein [Patescibacteria group bacterium]
MKKQNQLLVAALAVVILSLVATLYLSDQRTTFSPQATPSYQNYDLNTNAPAINNPRDLGDQLTNLDNVDLNQIDQTLNDNSSDANTF